MSAAEATDEPKVASVSAPEAGPSRTPSLATATASASPSAASSTVPLTAEGLANHAHESLSSSLPDFGPSSEAGWLRFLTLLRELSDSQRLGFTAEILALENYLTTRLRYELSELNELVAVGNVDTLVSSESWKANDIAIEGAANELMTGVGLQGAIEAASEVISENAQKARSKIVHVK